jgi:hypothetical protein
MAQENTKTIIPYNVNICWNYTLVMLEAALKQRPALQNFISNHSELKHLKFDSERWKRFT